MSNCNNNKTLLEPTC